MAAEHTYDTHTVYGGRGEEEEEEEEKEEVFSLCSQSPAKWGQWPAKSSL